MGKWVSGEPTEAQGTGRRPVRGQWSLGWAAQGCSDSHPSPPGAASSQTFTLLTPGARRQRQVEVSPSPAPKKGRGGCRPGPRG